MGSFLDFGSIFFRIPALLIALTIHEYAHAQMSYALGDPTPRFEGRLTMNPMAHLDILGVICLVLAGFGWAKPVSINPVYYRNRRLGSMQVALAGPASNLALCLFSVLLMFALNRFGVHSKALYNFLRWLMMYNVWFAFFNLIPLPPLDGSKVLSFFLSPRLEYEIYGRIAPYSFYILMILVFTGMVSPIMEPFVRMFLKFSFSLANIIF